MEFTQLVQRAKQIREKYATLEKKKYGKEWTRGQLMQGFIKDVDDLKEILSSQEISNNKLSHELSDCLWSIIILADKYDIDLEKSFMKTMDDLDKKIKRHEATTYFSGVYDKKN